MSAETYLINTARPEIMCKEDLIEALHWLKGYATDFYDKDFKKFDNVIMTDHIGGKTKEARASTDEYVFDCYMRSIGVKEQEDSE
jgi:phosphoglycerate dehydrogenase-like enzyme